MFGGLHIEILAFTILGEWLEGSGWTSAICNDGIASSGVAGSWSKAVYLTRTRHVHKVAATTLYVLAHEAYDQYKDTTQDDNHVEVWGVV